MGLPETTIAIILSIIAAWLIFGAFRDIKKVIYNGIVGLVAMVVLNLLGVGIPINIVTVIIVALTGIFGLAAIIVLHFLGIMF
jgi:pro-sigmaK processing inhibitor BofA